MARETATIQSFERQLSAIAKTAYVTNKKKWARFRNRVKALLPDAPSGQSDFLEWWAHHPHEYASWVDRLYTEENPQGINVLKVAIGTTWNYDYYNMHLPVRWAKNPAVMYAISILPDYVFSDAYWMGEQDTIQLRGTLGTKEAYDEALKSDSDIGKFCRAVDAVAKVGYEIEAHCAFVEDENSEQTHPHIVIACCSKNKFMEEYDYSMTMQHSSQIFSFGKWRMGIFDLKTNELLGIETTGVDTETPVLKLTKWKEL